MKKFKCELHKCELEERFTQRTLDDSYGFTAPDNVVYDNFFVCPECILDWETKYTNMIKDRYDENGKIKKEYL